MIDLKKFLEAQKAKAQADEQSAATFKDAIEQVIKESEEVETPPVEEPEVPVEPEPEPEPEVPTEPETPVLKPFGQPEIKVGEVTQNSIAVSWDKMDVDYYKLYINYDSGGWDEIHSLSKDVTEFKLAGLVPENTYKLILQGYKAGDKKNSLPVFPKTPMIPIFIPELTESVTVDIDLIFGVDNTVYLQDQLDKIPNGSPGFPTIVNFPVGSFNVEGSVIEGVKYASKLWRKHNIMINAEGCELYVTESAYLGTEGDVGSGKYSHRRQFVITECKNVKAKGLKVKGANKLGTELGDSKAPEGYNAYVSYREFEHNYWIEASEDIELIDCIGLNAFGDGFCVGGGLSKNIVLTNCQSIGAGRQGIAAYNNIKGLKIESLKIIKARRSGIDLETDDTGKVDVYENEIFGYIHNVEISNCEIECHLTPFAAGGHGDVSYVNIHHNKYSGTGNSVYCRSNNLAARRTDWTFTNNERLDRFGSTAPCLKFGKTDNVLIENNIDHYKSDADYASNSYATNFKVVSNTLDGGKTIRIADVKNIETDLEIIDNTHLLTPNE